MSTVTNPKARTMSNIYDHPVDTVANKLNNVFSFCLIIASLHAPCSSYGCTTKCLLLDNMKFHMMSTNKQPSNTLEGLFNIIHQVGSEDIHGRY